MYTFKLMSIVKCILILLTILSDIAISNICDFNVKLIQTLHSEGFHRNITYEIEYGAYDGQASWYEGCSVGLEQVLPSGLYASPDELDEIRYKTTTIFKSKVDIEVSAEQANPIIVHLLGSVQGHRTVLFLPVHARYHKAVAGGGTARVDIPPPHLYLHCGPNRLFKCDDTSSTNSFCPQSSSHQCLWKQVPIVLSEPLGWRVPRGDGDQHNLVLFGTAAVVAFGSLYVLNQIHCYKMRQHKLKKQRTPTTLTT